MSPSPYGSKVSQGDLDAALGALRLLAEKAERAMSPALVVETHSAIAALCEAAEFDGVGQ